ncbi:ABC transporter ATP-binding protein [Rheinheimera sp. SA_1]|uniref:ABC transporter ATP-binding protein n=1 Tax=Rheinheimera sp. SA_1 TaxID=1827365 RepID=UPI0008025421|nr:ABC transporter ATP-binding protein [Rheinheimera sp. SA_1]OBP16323.1 ABC transporter ATP-binding protein [Rheinheimera sp. SA_1]
MNVIELEQINKVFVTDEMDTHALSQVSLQVMQGEFVSITGPSGCGKSTLLSILGLLDTCSSGVYKLNGSDVTELNATQRAQVRNRDIGFIFQSFNLIPELSVFDNVALPLIYQRRLNQQEIKQKAMYALEKVNMVHRLKHYPGQLSGGQQQRVAVARALSTDPKVLLADEPTGNLDSANGAAVMELLAALHREGSTICMVTHDERYTNLAQRNIHLHDGRIATLAVKTKSAANF